MADGWRRAWAGAWLLVAALLAGCLPTDAPPASASGLAATQQAGAEAGQSRTGTLHLLLSPASYGSLMGWQLEVSAAERHSGFKPYLSPELPAGENIRLELWPDRYHVRLLYRGEVKRDEWLEVIAGRATVIHVSITMFGDLVTVRDEVEYEGRTTAQTTYHRSVLLPIQRTYEPLHVEPRPGLTGRYWGPHRNGRPIGRGLLELYQDKEKIAVIEQALGEDGRLGGTPLFADGRTIDTPLGADLGIPDGAITVWPDGRGFQGSYDGLLPGEGSLTRADGTVWQGAFERSEPSGDGVLLLSDGTAFHDVPGSAPAGFDGPYPCVTPKGDRTTCHFAQGRRLASAEAYHQEVAEAREQARIAAETPPPPAPAEAAGVEAPAYATLAAAPPAPAPAPAIEPEPARRIDGCSWVEGRFVTDAGLSRLDFDGNGSGHLWQQTHGGSAVYTFDIDFTYRGARDSMSFDYGPAIYRDASGAVVNRQSVPGGEGSCAYDGQSITIGGQTYRRR